MGCCRCLTDCGKFLVFVLNFVAWAVVSALLCGCGFLLWRSKDVLGFHIEPDLSADNPTALFFSLCLIIITVLAFLFIFTFLGCCGAACSNRCMLGSFIIILLVFLGATVGGISLMFTQFSDEVALFQAELQATIPYYDILDRNSIVRLFWDNMQPYLKCCGAESWRDWVLAEGLKPGRKVPASCCIPGRESDCVYQPDMTNAYTTGCVERVELPFRITFWAVPGVMLFMLILSLFVCARSGPRADDYDDDYAEGRRDKRRTRRDSRMSQYSEETGYVYQQSPPSGGNAYSSQMAYNPSYNRDGYPIGVSYPPTAPVPEYNQPLIQPPAYHDVVAQKGSKAYNR